MKLLEQQSAMAEAMSSSESCKAQMSKELEVLHEVCRSLSEMDGHHGRELWFLTVLGIIAGIVGFTVIGSLIVLLWMILYSL